jgi:hypothetical protein
MENTSLVLDLVEWVAAEPRAYDVVMAAWRTTCPRLTVWEDAVDARLVRTIAANGTVMVHATDRGRAFMRAHDREGT